MATTNIYLSASADTNAWATYFGKGDTRNICQKSTDGHKVEGFAELEGLCHLYRRWTEDSSAPEGVVSIHTRSLSLITWIRVCIPTAQEHGWKAAAKHSPVDIEPVLRCLHALFDNVRISCPKTTVKFSLVPEDVDHAWLRRARRSADRAVDVKKDVDWRGLTLHVRRKLRDLVSIAQFWASAEELERAERLLKDAEEYAGCDSKIRKEDQPQRASVKEASATKGPEPSKGSSVSKGVGEQDMQAVGTNLSWIQHIRWLKAGAVQVCVPLASVELTPSKSMKHKEWYKRYADLCKITAPNFPNVRVEWKESAGNPNLILNALVSLFGGKSVNLINAHTIAHFDMDFVARCLVRQTIGPVADPLGLVVVFRRLTEQIGCVGNLPILAAAATRRSPVKFLCLPVGTWGSLFKSCIPVGEETCFALTVSSYAKNPLVVKAVNELPHLKLSDAPTSAKKNTILGKRKCPAKKTAAKKKARSV